MPRDGRPGTVLAIASKKANLFLTGPYGLTIDNMMRHAMPTPKEKDMQSTFHASDSGQAVIRNTTAVDSEQLVVTLHPGSDSMVDIQIREEVSDGEQVSNTISINQPNLQKLFEWLRDQGVVD